tara:strand:- start:53 stop:3814 length:3762 start_codon:yes stop_codon:yes gene_type:complete
MAENIASYQSQSFQDTVSRTEEYFKDMPDANKAQVDEYLKYEGYDPVQFREQWAEQGKAVAGGEEIEPGAAVGRVVGRAVGEAGRDLYDFASDVLPDSVIESFDSGIESVKDILPQSTKEELTALFDPYHGDGLQGTVEDVAGEVGSYFIPSSLAIKTLSGIGKGYRFLGGKDFILKGKSKEFTPEELSKGFTISDKIVEKAGKAGGPRSKLEPKYFEGVGPLTKKPNQYDIGRAIKYATGWTAGTTIAQDPEENIVNMLVEAFPEATESIKDLAIDPDDTGAEQRLDALLNNFLLEAPLTAITSPLMKFYKVAGSPNAKALGEAAHRMEKSVMINSESPVSSIVKKIKSPKLGKWFGSRRGTDDDMLASVIKREQAGSQALTMIESLNKTLATSLKQTYGSGYTDEVLETVNRALSGNKKALQEITTNVNPKTGVSDVADTVTRMRGMIDDLSESVAKDLDGDLKIVIGKNKKAYLNRSYRAFEDPKWKGLDESTPEIRAAATTYLSKQGITQEFMEPTLRYLASGMKGNVPRSNNKQMNEFLNQIGEVGITGSKPFSTRSKTAAPIKALWGQYKDPFKSFGDTFEKLSIIKAEQDFLKQVRDNLIKRNVVSKAKDGKLSDLGKVVEDRMFGLGRQASQNMTNPLKGLYADEAYASMLANGLDIQKPSGPILKNWVRLKALSQIAKTVLSPATHARNVMGNNIMMIANGMLPGGKGVGKFISNRLLKMNDEQFAKEIGELQRLGILDSDVKASVIKANLDDLASSTVKGQGLDKISRMLDKATRGSAKKIQQTIFQLYRDEDNLYKMLHFNKTKDYLRKAFPNIDEKELMEMAAQRTRDLMPNYNLVNNALKYARRMPVGDFISFPAEMVRITKNLAKYTFNDIKSGNPALRREGLKRLGGMTAAGVGGDIAVSHSMNVMGISEDQAKAIDKIGPEYERGVPKIFTSPIKKDKNGRVSIDYLSLGPIDPFEYIKYFARATNTALLSGEDEVDWGILGMGVMDKTLAPFFAPSMLTEGLLKTYQAVQEGKIDTLAPDSFEKALYTAIGPFEPGFVPLIKKRLQYERSMNLKRQQGEGAIAKYGDTITEKQVDLLPNLLGVGQRTLDINSAAYRKLTGLARDVQGSRNKFKDSFAYKDQTLNDPEGLFDAWKTSQQSKLRGYKRLKSTADFYKLLDPENKGLSDEDFFRSMTGDGKRKMPAATSKLIFNAWQNKFFPDGLTEQDMMYLRSLGKTIPQEKIYEMFRQLQGSKIED